MSELLDQLPNANDLSQKLLRNIDLQLANITGNDRYDAFGRSRVSETFTVGEFKQVHPEHIPLVFIDVVTGTGTITHKDNEALSELSPGSTDAGASAVRQTRKHFRYQSGKSTLVFFTGTLGESITNVRSRSGFFNSDNGLYFEQSDGVVKVVRRTKTSGSVVNVEFARADWNMDTMDGNGPSGINIDPTKTQIFVIDFSWLGVGAARMGFVIDNKIVYAHEFANGNVLTTVYMSTPNLPLRCEVENTGVAGSVSTIKHICHSVSSEGGLQPAGVPRHIGTGLVTTTIATALEPILSIRLNPDASRASIADVLVNVFNTGNKNFHWLLSLNPTITGGAAAVWTDVSADSILQMDTTRDGVIEVGNEGHMVAGGYGTGKDGITEPVLLQDSDVIMATSNLAGTLLDELVISAQTFTATDSFTASIDLRELV